MLVDNKDFGYEKVVVTQEREGTDLAFDTT